LTNLSGNAIKFTERGEVTLKAALESQCDGTATLRFTITDTGIGIRPDRVAALFSPFTQVDDSTTRRYGGTGLGLAISKHLVEMMGGTIGVESREGAGSSFWFTAVFQSADGLALPPAAEPAATGQQKTVSERINTRILIADDNTTNRIVTRAQLQKLGYQADVVCNGAEAVEALQQCAYDLVLMDCEMPVMDGYEATRRIRQSAQSNIPIIAVTADAMSTDRERCLSVGMSDYLSKPVDLGRLAEMLVKWLPASDTADVPHPSRSQNTSVFDNESMMRRMMDDKELAGTVIQEFLESFPSQFFNLRARLEDSDTRGVRLHAHAIKGAAAMVAADELRAAALGMENAAMLGRLDHCGELLPRVVEEFERLKSALATAGWLRTRKEVTT
jgi:CheY-like chemotaxis protein/HPt (histidine-containing phosphotransfer) domain-containing protein